MQIHILLLKYSINFHDADDGDCYAGEGSKIIKVFSDKQKAIEMANRLNLIFNLAEKEHTIFPIQPNNQILKNELGFDRFDIDDGCHLPTNKFAGLSEKILVFN